MPQRSPASERSSDSHELSRTSARSFDEADDGSSPPATKYSSEFEAAEAAAAAAEAVTTAEFRAEEERAAAEAQQRAPPAVPPAVSREAAGPFYAGGGRRRRSRDASPPPLAADPDDTRRGAGGRRRAAAWEVGAGASQYGARSEHALLHALDIDSEEVVRLKRQFRVAAYTPNGQDPRQLFRHFDRDSSGGLSLDEFTEAARKSGKIKKADMSDADLRELFIKIDLNNPAAEPEAVIEARAELDRAKEEMTGADELQACRKRYKAERARWEAAQAASVIDINELSSFVWDEDYLDKVIESADRRARLRSAKEKPKARASPESVRQIKQKFRALSYSCALPSAPAASLSPALILCVPFARCRCSRSPFLGLVAVMDGARLAARLPAACSLPPAHAAAVPRSQTRARTSRSFSSTTIVTTAATWTWRSFGGRCARVGRSACTR